MLPTIPLLVSANERLSFIFLRNRKIINFEKKMRNEKEAFLRRLLYVKQKERVRGLHILVMKDNIINVLL
jgi:hypothetical protein